MNHDNQSESKSDELTSGLVGTEGKNVIEISRFGKVAMIRFSRPPNNHFSTSLIAELADAFEMMDEDPAIHATVLASKGRNFCAGADLITGREEPTILYGQALRLFSIRKPIVAAVQGAAIGGGLGLALAADFRVVSSNTRMAANFVKLGIHPGFGVTHVLPIVVGFQKAAELLYTGQRIDGNEAHRIGLADRLVEEERLTKASIEFARQMAENAPLAVEATRATLRSGLADAIRSQTDIEAGEQLKLRVTDDFAEGVRAVTERRPGNWTRR